MNKVTKKTKTKTTGKDGITPKILKIAKQVTLKPSTQLLNKSIGISVFPEKLKEAQVEK